MLTTPANSPSPPSPKPIIVGIDLGTTNSLIALCDEHGPRILSEPSLPTQSSPDIINSGMVPSVVRYQGSISNRIVGAQAKEQAPTFPRTTITSVKRLMGRSIDDAAADLPFLPYSIIAGERNTIRISLPPESPDAPAILLSPEEVSAHILLELRHRAERILGHPISKAVITVPAYFDDAQRQATRIAGRLAGLEVVRIVPEPTAAALAYGLGLDRANPRNTKPSTVAVYDLGGGTFDISILRLTPNTPETAPSANQLPDQQPNQQPDPFFFEVLATNGDTHLGGDDIDLLLVALFEREIAALVPNSPSPSPSPSPSLARELIRQAEQAKIALSSQPSVSITIPLSSTTYQRTLTRAEFDSLITPLIDRTLTACNHAMRDAKVSPATLDALVLVGGSTRIPLVRAQLKAHFGLEPYTALNPDEVVALGAAVQAATLSGHHKGTLLLDVIPLSLGLETVGGAVAKIIARNTMVPIKATEMFSTSVDNQTAIRLTIYQGEREMAADCRKLAELILRGVPPMPAGVPQVQVQFTVDVNGVLSVDAVERRSGKRAALQIIPNHGLTPEEVARIEQESYTFAREDMHRHRIVDLIANTSLDIKWINDGLTRIGDQLEPTYREQLKASIQAAQTLINQARADWKNISPDDLHRAKESLDRLSVTLHETSITASLRGTLT